MRVHSNAALVLCHYCGYVYELWHAVVVAVVVAQNQKAITPQRTSKVAPQRTF